jgi:SAM-dependent methyltransferase
MTHSRPRPSTPLMLEGAVVKRALSEARPDGYVGPVDHSGTCGLTQRRCARDTVWVAPPDGSYYRRDLALVHHRGFGFHARACAPGILALLEPVRSREGLVLELGCGTGLLTRELTAAGHRVIATDASPAMLELARSYAPAADIRTLVLPRDPLPQADAVVSVGHVLNYLPDDQAIDHALSAIARSLRPGGLLAVDICDLAYGQARHDAPPAARIGEDWAIITQFSLPAPNRLVRRIATFIRDDDGSWRRDDETHHNILIDTERLSGLLAAFGVEAKMAAAFGTEQLLTGLRVLIGRRAA